MNAQNCARLVCSLIFSLAFLSPALLSAQEQQELQWWRGNLHTHSLWSDGNDFPEMITKWYIDNGYQFLALTDHNVLSRGDRWMDLSQIEKRAGEAALRKYRSAFGDEWVETRTRDSNGKSIEQVRLKPLGQFRDKFESKNKFLLIEAEEISDRAENLPIHMNATNLNSVIAPVGGKTVVEAINNNLRAAQEQADKIGQPILVHLNHPNFQWAVTAEEMAEVTNEKFFEVYNGHPSINHLGDDSRPSVEKMWDICNTLRVSELKTAPMFGLATDDSHHYHNQSNKKATSGRGWIVVRAKSLDPESLINAINSGEFYSSSGIEIDAIDFDKQSGRLDLKIKPVNGVTFETKFIGTMKDYDRESKVQLNSAGKPRRATKLYSNDVGKVLATVDGVNPGYQCTGNELYIRAVVTSSKNHPNPSFKNQKEQAWTQPVVWEK